MGRVGVSCVKRWICILFHKKETRALRIPDAVFTIDMGLFRGCSKCDLWRRLPDDCK